MRRIFTRHRVARRRRFFAVGLLAVLALGVTAVVSALASRPASTCPSARAARHTEAASAFARAIRQDKACKAGAQTTAKNGAVPVPRP